MIRLDHIAIAVRDDGPLLRLIASLLAIEPYRREPVEQQGVETIFLPTGRTKLELIRPLGAASPISAFLEKRGDGLHHLAFEVRDLDSLMERARSLNLTPLSETPLSGADGKRIFFLHPRETHGVLLEFCQQDRADLPTRELHLSDATVSVYRGGAPDSEPLLLIAGELGGLQVDFGHLIPVLEREFDVIAVESKGEASAPWPPAAILSAETLLSALGELGVESPWLLGYSTGGSLALEVAMTQPVRVRGIALYGVNQSEENWPEITESNRSSWSAAVTISETALRRQAWARVASLPLENLDVNALVMCGDRDPHCSVEDALGLFRRMPHSSLSVFPGADHDLQSVDPEHVLDVLSSWITGPTSEQPR